MSDQEWRRKAACGLPPKAAIGVPDTVMFPKGEFGPSARHRVDIFGPAKALCRSCPVTAECLAAALEEEASAVGRFGVRGGKTPDERAKLRPRRQQGGTEPMPCPTAAGYRRHLRAGEQPCEGCRRAEVRRRVERERAAR